MARQNREEQPRRRRPNLLVPALIGGGAILGLGALGAAGASLALSKGGKKAVKEAAEKVTTKSPTPKVANSVPNVSNVVENVIQPSTSKARKIKYGGTKPSRSSTSVVDSSSTVSSSSPILGQDIATKTVKKGKKTKSSTPNASNVSNVSTPNIPLVKPSKNPKTFVPFTTIGATSSTTSKTIPSSAPISLPTPKQAPQQPKSTRGGFFDVSQSPTLAALKDLGDKARKGVKYAFTGVDENEVARLSTPITRVSQTTTRNVSQLKTNKTPNLASAPDARVSLNKVSTDEPLNVRRRSSLDLDPELETKRNKKFEKRKRNVEKILANQREKLKVDTDVLPATLEDIKSQVKASKRTKQAPTKTFQQRPDPKNIEERKLPSNAMTKTKGEAPGIAGTTSEKRGKDLRKQKEKDARLPIRSVVRQGNQGYIVNKYTTTNLSGNYLLAEFGNPVTKLAKKKWENSLVGLENIRMVRARRQIADPLEGLPLPQNRNPRKVLASRYSTGLDNSSRGINRRDVVGARERKLKSGEYNNKRGSKELLPNTTDMTNVRRAYDPITGDSLLMGNRKGIDRLLPVPMVKTNIKKKPRKLY